MCFNKNPTSDQNQVFNLKFNNFQYGDLFLSPKQEGGSPYCVNRLMSPQCEDYKSTYIHTPCPNKQSTFRVTPGRDNKHPCLDEKGLFKTESIECTSAVHLPAAYGLPYFLSHTTKHLQPSVKDVLVYRKNTLLDLTNRSSRVFAITHTWV